MSIEKPAKPAAPVEMKVEDPDATDHAVKDRVDAICAVIESESGTD